MTVEALLTENGYENIKILKNFSYDSALVGISHDNRAVYDFNKMVQWLIDNQGFGAEEAVEWVEYNTIRSLPHMSPGEPIIVRSIGGMLYDG